MANLTSIAGRLVVMLALSTALAGAVIGGVLLHDWLLGVPSQEIAKTEPLVEPAVAPPTKITVLPVSQAVADANVAPPTAEPAAAPPAKHDAPPASQVEAVAPVEPGPSRATPVEERLTEPVAAMTLPFTEAGPESAAAVPTSEAAPIPATAAAATWLRHAVPVAVPAGRVMIAVVIDDFGVNNPRNAGRVLALPGPLTLALMSYAPKVTELAASARAAGHELLVHVPMEPEDGNISTGPNAMRTDLSVKELRQRLRWALTRFDGYVGINNHMGSEFTASDAGMAIVLQELRERGLLFLDSKTTAATVGPAVASRLGVPYAERDVFLDNETSVGAVWDQLGHLEDVARSKGYAIAIGHPHDGTIEALAAWLPTVEQRGFSLVPVSRIVQRNLLKDAATN